MAASRDKSHGDFLAAALTDPTEAAAFAAAGRGLDGPQALADEKARRADLERLISEAIKNIGDSALNLAVGEQVELYVVDEVGSGQVQDKAKIALSELIAKVNDLFEDDLTPGDKLVGVHDVIKCKLMGSEKLAEQAANNTKEQFEHRA